MKTSGFLEMILLKKGESFKVLQINGEVGTKMPLHYSTKEAVVIVQEGQAQLKIDEIKHLLQVGNILNHTPSVKAKFKALVIMSKDLAIEFV